MAQPNQVGSQLEKPTLFGNNSKRPVESDDDTRLFSENTGTTPNPYADSSQRGSGRRKASSLAGAGKTGSNGLVAGFLRLKPAVRIGLAGSAIALVAFCCFQATFASPSMIIVDDDNTEELEETSVVQTGPRIAVHVDGAVKTPGLYSLQAKDGDDLRINDVVEAAGGLTADADVTTINLAAKVEDGEKIHIPKAGETGVSGDATVAATGSASTSQSGLVNINTADAAALQTLSGIGEATAKAIIDDRTKNGPFASIEDLMRVSGIGEKKFEKIRSYICV